MYATQDFVLLPSIGPLVVGHGMLVSREHRESLAEMPPPALSAYERLVERATAFLEQRKLALVEVEHGSTGFAGGGACIVHTHVHWLPSKPEIVRTIGDHLKLITKVDDANQLVAFKSIAYVSVRCRPGGYIYVYDARDSPSQLARRLIAEQLGLESWDWAVTPRPEVVRLTISFWNDFKTVAHDIA